MNGFENVLLALKLYCFEYSIFLT